MYCLLIAVIMLFGLLIIRAHGAILLLALVATGAIYYAGRHTHKHTHMHMYRPTMRRQYTGGDETDISTLAISYTDGVFTLANSGAGVLPDSIYWASKKYTKQPNGKYTTPVIAPLSDVWKLVPNLRIENDSVGASSSIHNAIIRMLLDCDALNKQIYAEKDKYTNQVLQNYREILKECTTEYSQVRLKTTLSPIFNNTTPHAAIETLFNNDSDIFEYNRNTTEGDPVFGKKTAYRIARQYAQSTIALDVPHVHDDYAICGYIMTTPPNDPLRHAYVRRNTVYPDTYTVFDGVAIEFTHTSEYMRKWWPNIVAVLYVAKTPPEMPLDNIKTIFGA